MSLKDKLSGATRLHKLVLITGTLIFGAKVVNAFGHLPQSDQEHFITIIGTFIVLYVVTGSRKSSKTQKVDETYCEKNSQPTPQPRCACDACLWAWRLHVLGMGMTPLPGATRPSEDSQ